MAAVSSRSQSLDEGWFKNLLSEGDAKILEHSGKMVLLFEILRMAEDLNDKVYVSLSDLRSFFTQRHCEWIPSIDSLHFCIFRLVFSQSLISLNLIETFLEASHFARETSSFKGIRFKAKMNMNAFKKHLLWWYFSSDLRASLFT